MSVEKFKDKLRWYGIDWKQVNTYISDIQADIVVAQENFNNKKLHKLQNELIYSFEGRAMAIRIVTSNKGRNTPGIDNVVWNTASDKYNGIRELGNTLNATNYKPLPVKRVWIPKANGKLRPLGIPTMKDRGLQALIKLAMEPSYEVQADWYSYGFRKYRGTHDAIYRIRSILGGKYYPRYIWDADIKGCFDNICHKYLEEAIKPHINQKGRTLIHQWLKAGIIENGNITKVKKGVPQGGILSPLLANLALDGIEFCVRGTHKTSIIRGKGSKDAIKALTGRNVIRYADDFIITNRDKEVLINEIIPEIKLHLSKRGLSINEEKSKILDIEKEKLLFLGWEIGRVKRLWKLNHMKDSSTVLVIRARKEAMTKLKKQIKEAFKTSRPLIGIIRELNPILRGWSNYYRTSYHCLEQFTKLQKYIFNRWFSWAKKKHRTRSKKWIIEKYIQEDRNRKWSIIDKDHEEASNNLFDMSTSKIEKIRNLKPNINPFTNEEYYVERINLRNVERFRKRVLIIAKYRCALCNGPLDGQEQIDLHHVIPKREGGQYTLDNIVPLHKTCHEATSYGRAGSN